MQLWTDLKTISSALVNTITATARTVEKSVVLVENEVDGLTEIQKLRIEQDLIEFKEELTKGS